MADEKNEDQTPGSDPSSPREPDDLTTPGAAEPVPSDDATDEPTDQPGPDESSPEPPSPDEKFHEQVGADADAEQAESDSDRADEPALVGASASRRPVRRESSEASTEKKGRSTRRREADEADGAAPRTGPVTFVNESVGELRKVVWPTSEMMRTYFVVVLVFVLFMITVVSLLDLLFGWALLQVFR